jgi:hypothetical protein
LAGCPLGWYLDVSWPVGKIEEENQKGLEVHQKIKKKEKVNYFFYIAAAKSFSSD